MSDLAGPWPMPVKPASSACLRGDSAWHAGMTGSASELRRGSVLRSSAGHLPDDMNVSRFDTSCVCLAARVREFFLLVALHFALGPYTHLRRLETVPDPVSRLLLRKNKHDINRHITLHKHIYTVYNILVLSLLIYHT